MKLRSILLAALTILLLMPTESATAAGCKIRNLNDATACLEKLGDRKFQAEDEPDIITTDQPKRLATVLFGLGAPKYEVQRALQAEYVGAIIFHDDEHHIFYFTMKNGESVTPKEVYDLNIVDLALSLRTPLSKSSPMARPETYVLGFNIHQYDIEEDLRYGIEEALSKEK
jgi:hypothetical protein